jgi:hypothetical protein
MSCTSNSYLPLMITALKDIGSANSTKSRMAKVENVDNFYLSYFSNEKCTNCSAEYQKKDKRIQESLRSLKSKAKLATEDIFIQ